MSQASLTKIPAPLRSANGFAALASLGVHGLLLTILPHLPLDSKQVSPQRTIGLVELTPAEQSRLPQTATQTEQVALPLATQQSILPPLPPPPPFPTDILPPLPPVPPPPTFQPPPIGNSLYQSPLRAALPEPKTFQVPSSLINQNQALNAPLGVEQLPNPPAPPLYRVPQQLSPRSLYKIPNNRNLPSINGLKPSEPFSPTDTQPSATAQQNINQSQNQVASNQQLNPATISKQLLPERTKQELIARRNALRELAADKTGSTPTAPIANSASKEKLMAALRKQQPQSNPTASTPTVHSTPALSERTKQELIARRNALRERLAANRATLSNPTAPIANSASKEKLMAALRKQQPQNNPTDSISPATAQTIAQVDAFKDHLQKVQQEHPKVVTQAPIRDKINTCNQQLDGDVAILGAVVNPQGNIISGPDLISNTSNAEVQQTAKAYVRKYQFQKTDTPTNQQFRLEFKYNNSGKCAAPKNTSAQK